MKWIGQHIWDFISRFRSDVYLESVDSGTIASGGNLGLDSNNKIVKSASPSGTIDLTSEVTGTLPVGSGGTGATTLMDNAILTGTGTSAITAESTLFYVDGILTVSSSDSNEPGVYLTNSNEDSTSSLLEFQKTADGADGDDIGRIIFDADNAVSQVTSFAQILSEIQTAADGQEAGKISLTLATAGSGTSALQQALTATGHGTNNTVNIGLGYGATSLTTIAGDLDIDGDAITSAGALTVTPGGTFSIAGGANEIDLTTTGTIDMNAKSLDVALTDSSTIELTSSEDAEDLLIRVTGANNSSLLLRGDGTGTDAVGIIADQGGVRIDTPELLIESATSTKPVVEIKNTTSDSNGPELKFNNTNAGGDASDSDFAGKITFNAMDDGTPTETNYAQIFCRIDDATDTEESGILSLQVANHDGGMGTGLKLTGGSANDEVDVEIGKGGSSVTTVAGQLNVGESSAPFLKLTDNQIQFTPSTDDTVTIAAGTSGTLNITTVDDAGRNAELNITADGIISTTSSASQINTTYDFQSTTFENIMTAGKPSGKIIKYSPSVDASLTAGQVYYLRDTGSWLQADADSVSTSYGLLGLGMGGSSQTVGVMIQGFMRIPTAEILNTPTNVDGLPVYLGTEAGHFDFTAPSASGDIVRVLGYAIDDHLGDVLIYFNPDRTWIERG